MVGINAMARILQQTLDQGTKKMRYSARTTRRPAVTARFATMLLVLVASSPVYAQYGGWSSPVYSSTYEEGVQRGAGELVRSRAMANLLNSEAARSFEDARREYLENRLRATQTYFEMRRYNQEARRAERSPPLSMEQYVRIARELAPERLTNTQLDPLTGAVSWPLPLTRPEYQPYRQRIERLLQDRAAGFVVYGELRRVVEEFRAQLEADIDAYPSNDFIAANNFLRSLSYEAQVAQR
jgi:hypothetical protein